MTLTKKEKDDKEKHSKFRYFNGTIHYSAESDRLTEQQFIDKYRLIFKNLIEDGNDVRYIVNKPETTKNEGLHIQLYAQLNKQMHKGYYYEAGILYPKYARKSGKNKSKGDPILNSSGKQVIELQKETKGEGIRGLF